MKRKLPIESSVIERREFIRKGILIGMIPAAGMIASCKEKPVAEVTPTEDLMREHGLLNRIMLIYDYCRLKLTNRISFDFSVLERAAQIIRDFIENYHEQQEEQFVFPHFERKNKMPELVKILRIQHLAGRTLTDQLLTYGKLIESAISEEQRQKMINILDAFNTMYRPHEAREDTVLFPFLRDIIKPKEFDEMGDRFEENEHKLFGDKGFEQTVEKVALIERLVGIEDLSQFTPKT
jgi:hemerythrin-like domain-containing protein